MSTPTPSPARPIRTKRNFKALQLDVTQPAPQPEPELIPTRNAPPAAAAAANAAPKAPGAKKKRPPPMQLKTPKPVGDTPTGEEGGGFGSGLKSSAAPSAGLGSASQLARTFRRAVGMTPGVYRDSIG